MNPAILAGYRGFLGFRAMTRDRFSRAVAKARVMSKAILRLRVF